MAGNCSVYEDWAPNYDQDLSQVGFCVPQGLALALAQVFQEPNFPFRANENIKILDIGSGTGQTAKAIIEVVDFPGKLLFTGVDISPAMNAQANAKNIYRDLLLQDLNLSDCDGKFELVVSTGTFAQGHVSLDRIFGILEKNVTSGGLMMFTSKSTYFDQEISDRLGEIGCRVEQERFQHFNDGATCELLTIWKD